MIHDALFMLSTESRKLLNDLEAELAKKLLNFRNNSHLASTLSVGKWIYVPNRILPKKHSTLRSTLGRITGITDPMVKIKLAIGNSINHHMNQENALEKDINVYIHFLMLYPV